MQAFFEKYTFILSFSIMTLVFNMAFGAKFTEMFLLLVLLSMVVLNAEKFKTLFAGMEVSTNE